MKKKLHETNQIINIRKTKIDTAYHGVPFLGKVTYPYKIQTPTKEVIKRTLTNARESKFSDLNPEKILSSLNSRIGSLKKYNSYRLMNSYVKTLLNFVMKIIEFDYKSTKFKLKE